MSDHPTPPARQPIFNVPPVTKALLLVNVAVHLLRLLLPADIDDALVSTFAFVPARYTVADGLGWPALVDPITYQFLHASFVHLGVNMLALLAFGSGVERRTGGWRMLVFFLVCGVVSAAAHLAAYAGLAPVTRRSGSSIRGELPSRRGNKQLKRALFLSAFAALRDPVSRAYYARKISQGKRHNQALIALARRRCDVLFAMLRDGTLYSPPQPKMSLTTT